MPIRHTDVLIVGGELAGAVAAAMLARTGKRVVLLEEGEGDDAEVAANVVVPPLDDLCPSLDHLPRAMAPLETLGQRQDLRRTVPLSTQPLQVLHPAHRLDLPADVTARRLELRREAGDAGARAAAALEE